jgi:hypothetical protein
LSIASWRNCASVSGYDAPRSPPLQRRPCPQPAQEALRLSSASADDSADSTIHRLLIASARDVANLLRRPRLSRRVPSGRSGHATEPLPPPARLTGKPRHRLTRSPRPTRPSPSLGQTQAPPLAAVAGDHASSGSPRQGPREPVPPASRTPAPWVRSQQSGLCRRARWSRPHHGS